MTIIERITHPRLAGVDQIAEEFVIRHRLPGMSLAITNGAGLLHAAGYGHADPLKRTPAHADTVYPWFSLTKIATATVAMQLVDDGRLDLDAPVHAFVPRFTVRSGAQPTVRDLLRHTAGAPNPIPVRWVRRADAPLPDQSRFIDDLLRRHGVRRRRVGGPARYSNVGYLVLAEVVAQVTGEPFVDHVERVLLHPAMMASTGFTFPPGDDVAVGTMRAPAIVHPILRRLMPAGVVGGYSAGRILFQRFLVDGAGYGGLVGTVTDAARLAALHLADGRAVTGERVLSEVSARAMRDARTPGKPFQLGLGWYRRPSTPPGAVEHLGAGGGFYNAMRIDPARRLGLVVMANTTAAYPHDELFAALADRAGSAG